MEYIRITLGVGYVYGRIRAGNPNKHYTLHINSIPLVVKVVDTVLPHLRFKKQEVERKIEKVKRIESMMVSLRASRRLWTNEERKFLTENYGKLSVIDISEKLGKTYPAVNSQIWWMGLKKEPVVKRWTTQEEEKLRELTELGYTAGQISKELGRTIPAVYNRWKGLGIHGKYIPDPTGAINTRRELWKLQRMARGAGGVNPKYI